MGTRAAYFVGNRIWWAVSLFIGPVVGALLGSPYLAIAASALLVFPTFVLFDENRPWWSDDVRERYQDKAGMRHETRVLTAWAAIGLAAGIAVAVLHPWP